ncbi:GapS4a family protein [Aeromonas enteropelogenes]|uniref:GapS4a family protein n=1 Tax=Aeromonas enteropelogenes TaxID=29489 RepID=UPI003BA18678
MGEFSKKVGEHGELIVKNFLSMIGWLSVQEGETIPCEHGEKHKESSNAKTTHGIDAFYSVKSQLQDFTLDNIVVSVKYTSKPYPNAPSTKFKSHLKDLANTLECFMYSDFRAENNQRYEMTGIKSARDIGVLFWLTSDRESQQDVISKVFNVELDKSLIFSSMHVIDNSRASFIYDSISYIKKRFSEKDINFHYAFSSSNYSDSTIKKYGKIMPVEYLTSNVIPFRLVESTTGKVSFCLVCRDGFSEESINRLIYLASDVSQDFTDDFVFLFPDYDHLKHQSIVSGAGRMQEELLNKLNVEVYSFNESFEGLIHG